MAITDPEAIRFVNEVVRPMCEVARAFNARMTDATESWIDGIGDMFPDDSTPLDDGREEEGVSRLTGAEVRAAVTTLKAMQDASDDAIIAKPCVRPLEVSM